MAGSCSTATRTQIDVAKRNWPTKMINVHALAEGDAEIGARDDPHVGSIRLHNNKRDIIFISTFALAIAA